jgi:hypothetical protein
MGGCCSGGARHANLEEEDDAEEHGLLETDSEDDELAEDEMPVGRRSSNPDVRRPSFVP